jgi:hypothetical protein
VDCNADLADKDLLCNDFREERILMDRDEAARVSSKRQRRKDSDFWFSMFQVAMFFFGVIMWCRTPVDGRSSWQRYTDLYGYLCNGALLTVLSAVIGYQVRYDGDWYAEEWGVTPILDLPMRTKVRVDVKALRDYIHYDLKYDERGNIDNRLGARFAERNFSKLGYLKPCVLKRKYEQAVEFSYRDNKKESKPDKLTYFDIEYNGVTLCLVPAGAIHHENLIVEAMLREGSDRVLDTTLYFFAPMIFIVPPIITHLIPAAFLFCWVWILFLGGVWILHRICDFLVEVGFKLTLRRQRSIKRNFAIFLYQLAASIVISTLYNYATLYYLSGDYMGSIDVQFLLRAQYYCYTVQSFDDVLQTLYMFNWL